MMAIQDLLAMDVVVDMDGKKTGKKLVG